MKHHHRKTKKRVCGGTDLITCIREQCEQFNMIQSIFTFTPNNNIVHITNRETTTECGFLKIESNEYIYIGFIRKCAPNTGTEVIKSIEHFAAIFGYKRLGLEDDAKIGSKEVIRGLGFCEIYLSVLHILVHGETWYNKLGYKSSYYDKEKKHNKKILKEKFIDFVKKIESNLRGQGYFMSDSFKNSFDACIEHIKQFVPKEKYDDTTVQEMFTIIQSKLKVNGTTIDCKNPETLHIVNLLRYIENTGVVINTNPQRFNKDSPFIIIFRKEADGLPVIQYKEVFATKTKKTANKSKKSAKSSSS